MKKDLDWIVDEDVRDLIRRALSEDIGPGDATSEALFPENPPAAASLVTRRACVLAGAPIAVEVFRQVDPATRVSVQRPDGSRLRNGETVLKVVGTVRSLLIAERTALNFMQRLCGIATLTHRYIEEVHPHPCAILDTRKTTPSMRRLEKYAVRCGGGQNHRMGLYDRVLIKDNHLRCLKKTQSLADLVRGVRDQQPEMEIEVEVDSLDQLREVLPARPDWILLDNMTPPRLRECVEAAAGSGCKLEASGGITLDTANSLAASGVDALSIGALTHSAPAIDLALDFLES